MTSFEIFGLYLALNILLLIWLVFRVIALRISKRVSIGDGDDKHLEKRIRAHANFVENTPFALLGLLACAQLSAPPLILHLIGGVYLIGRLLHMFGMEAKYALGIGRRIGMVMTLLSLGFTAFYILYLSLIH